MRTIAFLMLLALAPFIPPLVFVPFMVLYALLWSGYDLLLIGFLIDAFYGSNALWPYYTLSAGGVLLFVEWLKPYLSFYTTSNV